MSLLIRSRVISTALAAMTVVVAAAVESSMPDTVRLENVNIVALKANTSSTTNIDSHEIEQMQVVSTKGTSQIAPNLYMPDYGSRMTSSIYVRGTGTRIDQPVIGLYIDNVPILNKDCYDFDLPDLDNARVTLGPQSTLFGRNTMSGIISLSTISPMNYQGIRLAASYASYNTVRASAGLYNLLSEGLGMSVSGNFTHTDGQYRNAYNNSHCGLENQGYIRWRTEWRPSGNLSVGNNLSTSVSRTSGYPYESLETRQINYNDTCFYRRTSIIDGISVKWLAPKFIVSSMTSIQYLDDNMTLDQDFTPQPYFTLTQKRHEFTATEDAVVKGSTGQYTWLGGLFSFYRNTDMNAPVTFKDYGIDQLIVSHVNEGNPYYPIVWDDDAFVLGSEFKMPTFNLGIYHESEYQIGNLALTAGLRLDYEWTKIDYNSVCHTSYTVIDAYTDPLNPTIYAQRRIDIDDRGSLSKSHTQLLPKIAATYRFNIGGDMARLSSAKVSIAKGYKAGGFNCQMFSDVLQQRLMSMLGITEKYDVDDIISYKPETSINYEVAANLAFPKTGLSVDASLFYTDITNLQLTVFPDGTTTGRLMTNAGSARCLGAEISVNYDITSRLSLHTAWGFTDSRFRHYDNGKEVFDGNCVPYAPANTIFAAANYLLPIKGAKILDALEFNMNCRGAGRIYWNEQNTEWQNFYALLGASVTLHRKDFSLSLWGTNLADCHYDVFRFVSIGHSFLQRGQARQIGLSLKLNINK